MPSINLSRRTFLAGTGATGTLLCAPALTAASAASAREPILFEARAGMASLLEGTGKPTSIWGYQGKVPGPLVRARQGDEVWIRLKNSLPQPTTIHWHGIRIDNAMDGVAGLTQKPVPPGGTFDYRFVVPDAGTFWYHPHNRSWEQMARGLYGALIVDEPDAPDVDQDIIMIVDDWLLKDDGAIHEESLGSIRDRSHAGRLGNILTVNGNPSQDFPVLSGQRIRLRLINTCNSRILKLRFEDMKPRVIALDGQPVVPYELEHGLVTIAPAQRADFLIDLSGTPGASHAITEVSQSRLVIGGFKYTARGPARERTSQFKLSDNNLQMPQFASARKVDLSMTGGAMGRFGSIMYKGKAYEIRDLVREHGMVWAFNGTAGMPEKPLFSARRGEHIAVRMINDTRWPHAMHFHGHHFKEAHGNAPWRDTILLEVNETRTVYLAADNPGKWMIHCHMLEHQAGGMATWFEVKA